MEVDCTWHTSFLGFGEDANGHASDCGSPREMKHLDTTCWILFPFQSFSVIRAWDQSTLIGPRYHSTYFTSTLGGRTGWLSFPRLHASGEISGFLFSGGGLSEKDRRLLKTVDTTTSSDMYSDVLCTRYSTFCKWSAGVRSHLWLVAGVTDLDICIWEDVWRHMRFSIYRISSR